MCSHDWRSVCQFLNLCTGANHYYICSKCGYEGINWYDGMSGGVKRTRKPVTDLRIQHKLNYNIQP